MYSCPQRAHVLMNFEGQNFSLLCSFIRCLDVPKDAKTPLRVITGDLMGKGKQVPLREGRCWEAAESPISSGTCEC